LVDEHQERCEIKEETDVEDPPELVDETAEGEKARASAWVRLKNLRLASKVNFIVTFNLILDGQ